MRPVLEMKRDTVQALKIGGDIHNDRVWKHPMLHEKLLAAGFKEGEALSVCYKTFTDEFFFVGTEREDSKAPSNDAPKVVGSSTGNSSRDSGLRSS